MENCLLAHLVHVAVDRIVEGHHVKVLGPDPHLGALVAGGFKVLWNIAQMKSAEAKAAS